MRSIGGFSEQKLTQIALQTVNLVELTTIYPNFGDFRQRCHSDAALPRERVPSLSDSGFLLQQRQRVVGRHNWRVFVFTSQFDLHK